MKDIDLNAIEVAYLVSNTPTYFIRRMLENSSVQELARMSPADNLLSSFRVSAQKQPETMADLVFPYCCLAALFIQNDGAKLRLATAVKAHLGYKWLEEIARTLVEMFVPTTVVEVKLPPTVVRDRPKAKISSNNVVVSVRQ